MKIGIIGANVGGPELTEQLVAVAQKAEQVGAESFWSYEHVIFPVDYQSPYPYHPSGKLWGTPEVHWVDPLIALATAGAATTRLRLGTGINILPQTNPLLLAKQAASLDYLTGGRLMLGLGAGWLKEEFDALGVPFEKRGRRMDDYLVAMKKVWSGEVVEHKSEFLDWSGFKSYPLPVQKPHMPLIIGGVTRPAIRRAVTHGDGWLSVGNADMLADSLSLLRECAQEAGRDLATLEISGTWFFHREGAESVKRYEDLGFARLVVPITTLGADPLAGLERLGDEVIAKL